MRILIAPDSFKESLTALEAAQAIQSGFHPSLVSMGAAPPPIFTDCHHSRFLPIMWRCFPQ